MSHAAAAHRNLDRRFNDALARDGEPSQAGALLPSRLRGKDARTMNGLPQTRVLFATLSECTSGRGTVYLRGWAGASNLVAFRGEDDEQGRPTWNLYLTERQPRDGGQRPGGRCQTASLHLPDDECTPATSARPAGGEHPASLLP